MDLGLNNKRVLVTGASRGIGRAIVEGFLCEGARVVFLARTSGPLEALAEQLIEKYSSEKVLSFRADCTNAVEWQKIEGVINDVWGGLDVVVANVGDGRSVSDALPEEAHFAKVWQANFTSAEQTARATLPFLQASNGCLLFISSIAGLEAIGAPTDYSVAKTALVALSKQLARKLAPQVRVNCLAPGNVFFPGGSWDEKLQADPSRIEQLIESTVPLKRFSKPEEIADAALFLCSKRASFITGTVLRVDGGQTVGLF
jgi:3-oxoacyl-[acyl-carrier protein] reductase